MGITCCFNVRTPHWSLPILFCPSYISKNIFNINRNAFEVGVFLDQVMERQRNVENLVVALQQPSIFFFRYQHKVFILISDWQDNWYWNITEKHYHWRQVRVSSNVGEDTIVSQIHSVDRGEVITLNGYHSLRKCYFISNTSISCVCNQPRFLYLADP